MELTKEEKIKFKEFIKSELSNNLEIKIDLVKKFSKSHWGTVADNFLCVSLNLYGEEISKSTRQFNMDELNYFNRR